MDHPQEREFNSPEVQLPDVHFGPVDQQDDHANWRADADAYMDTGEHSRDDWDDDDEEEGESGDDDTPTPPDVIFVLGFDPREFDEVP